MSSYFLNSLFSKYQPGEAWFPSGFEPITSSGRGGKPGAGSSDPGGGWRYSQAVTASGHFATYDNTPVGQGGMTNMAGTTFTGSYAYPSCAFSQAYPQMTFQPGAYQDQFAGYPTGGYPSHHATLPNAWNARAAACSNQFHSGDIDTTHLYGSLISQELAQETKDSLNNGLSDRKKDDDDGDIQEEEQKPVYKGPVFNWMKIPVPPTLFLQVNGRNVSNEIYVAVNEEINISCSAIGGKPAANLTWIINGIPFRNISFSFEVNRAENRTFDSFSNFQLRPQNESETVTCLSTLEGINLKDNLTLTVFTYETPTTSLLYVGKRMTTQKYVALHEEINVTCEASNARPQSNVTWITTKGSIITSVNSIISSTGSFFNTVSMLTFSMTEESVNVDCLISLQEANFTQTIHATFTTYVLPRLQLTVNGESVSNGSIFSINDAAYYLTCNASGARPTASLSWTRNEIPFDDPTIQYYRNTNPNSTISNFLYKPEEQNETVTCISRLGEVSKTEEVSARFLFYDKNEDKIAIFLSSYLWLILSASAVALILLLCVICVPYICVKRMKAYLSTNIAENLDLTYSRDFPMTHLTTNNHITTCKVTENACSTNATGLPAPPNLALPQIPYCKEEKSDDSEGLEDENNYYSTLHKKTPHGKMFYEKDMCMIYNMKLGRIYNRWMGTVNVPKESSKCVVMSTVTAEVLRKKEVHWDVFVKRVLELPKTNTLVKVEGIGVDKACLYIIHEHLTCETLFVRLNAHQNMGASNITFIPMFDSEVIAHMLEILEGMELLHSFGFVHPGLSTKKVLVTNQGNCKLYDFCLCEDACNVVRMKSQTPRTGNHFAPEVILRNEYTKASDLWSTAVVLWELMSGSPPFAPDDQMIDGDATIADLQKQWPIKHLRLRNSRLLECWNQDPCLRPTIYHLRLSILEITDSLDTYTFPENSKRAESASYEPMHGSDDVDT